MVGLASATAVTGLGLSVAPAGQADELTAPYFTVESFGFSEQQARELSASLGTRINRLASGHVLIDGDDSILSPPVRQIRVVPVEPSEDGNDSEVKEVVESTVDVAALKKMRFASSRALIKEAEKALPSLPEIKRTWVAASNEAEEVRPDGTSLGSYQLSTTVTARLTLAGKPLIGPGSYQKLVFGPGGNVAVGTLNNVELRRGGEVAIMSPRDALERCRAITETVTADAQPRLVYYAPGWTKRVTTVLPHYVCPQGGLGSGEQPSGTPSGVVIPAAPSQTPTVSLTAQRDGSDLTGRVVVRGGKKPYIVTWLTSGAEIVQESDEALSARVTKVDPKLVPDAPDPVVSVTVEDSNGMVAHAEVPLSAGDSAAPVSGPGPTAMDLVEIEQHTYWAAFPRLPSAQREAYGLRAALRRASIYRHAFFWRDPGNTWEVMFNPTGAGMFQDTNYADHADIAHYAGHGLLGSIYFDPPYLRLGSIGASSMRLGDTDLEFLNLFACQTMNATPGVAANTWYPTFQGLHIINGFKSNATTYETGWFEDDAPVMSKVFGYRAVRSDTNIVQAWAYAGIQSQKSGGVVRSLAPVRDGDNVTNVNDGYFRNYGPDIPNNRIGTFWVITTNT